MLVVLTVAMFLGIALLAGAALVATWREYGAAALAVRGELRDEDSMRGFEWARRELVASRGPASVSRLPVRPGQPILHSGLHAAA